jgi:hypothetical protein
VIRSKTTTLFEPGSVAAYGSEAWAIECRTKLQQAVDRAVGGQFEFDRDLRKFWEHAGWKALKSADGQAFASFRQFAMAERPYGLHLTPHTYKGLMRDIDKSMEEVAEDADAHKGLTRQEAGKLGGKGHKAIDNINSFNGTSADYLARRIARDHPDILERMKAGDYKSVRAAAKDAGIVKDKTPLQHVQTSWKHATLDDKRLIVGWILDRRQEDPELRQPSAQSEG